jgi:hypothetical protein
MVTVRKIDRMIYIYPIRPLVLIHQLLCLLRSHHRLVPRTSYYRLFHGRFIQGRTISVETHRKKNRSTGLAAQQL